MLEQVEATASKPKLDESVLVVQYDKMIYKFAKKLLYNFNSSDVCMELDDILQIGRMFVLQAIRQYDPDRGASLTTFVFLKLSTKFINLRRNMKVKNRAGTSRLEDMAHRFSDDEPNRDQFAEVGGEEERNRILDLATSFEKDLTAFEQKIFKDWFIECGAESIDKLIARHPNISPGRIRETLKDICELFDLGDFNERVASERIGKGWFDGFVCERPKGNSWDVGSGDDRSSLRYEPETGRTGIRVEDKAQDADADRQLQLCL